MLKDKKRLLVTISLLLIAVMGVSFLAYFLINRESNGDSYSIAGEDSERSAIKLSELVWKTNIDLIIEDSNSETGYMYNIVNIVPSQTTASGDITTYSVTDKNFKKMVIDKYKSSDEDGVMKADTVRVITLPLLNSSKKRVEATDNLSDIIDGVPSDMSDYTVNSLLNAADLIYIESPEYDSYAGVMSESVYNCIHSTYLGTNHKPIIVDTIKDTSAGTVTEEKTTYKTLINEISDRYLYSPVFGWDKDQSAEDFFDGKDSSNFFSKVLSEQATGKVLVLGNGQADGTNNWISQRFTEDMISEIYYGNEKYFPKKFDFNYVNVATLTNTSALDGYEFIIIENSAINQELPKQADGSDNAIYSALISMANGTQYIIFDQGNVVQKDSDDGALGNKYEELLDTLLTDEGTAMYDYVLPVEHGFFSSEAQTADGAKKIADVINGSNYRGSETNGRNGKKYRVLEIQPCYPIDEDIALSYSSMSNASIGKAGLKGNYYVNPGSVLTNTTVDEVPDNEEYYAFELTTAKIVAATGLKYNQIQVDQMSTDEFITDKDVVLDTYDLVYIGGNVSALTPAVYGQDYAGNFSPNSQMNLFLQDMYVTRYGMYTHTGNAVYLDTYPSNSTGIGDKNAYGRINGQKTSTLLNGNDITEIKLNELKDYIDAGMPILFSEDVSEAFEKVYGKTRMEQITSHDIDPDSNMFKLLTYAYENKSVSSSNGTIVPHVLWDMDITSDNTNDSRHENKDDRYGSKLREGVKYATLFSKDTDTDIKNVIEASETRPTLQITSSPKEYTKDDETTYNSKTDGKMTISANVIAAVDKDTEYTLSLYVDKDGDGTFDEDEKIDQKNSSGEVQDVVVKVTKASGKSDVVTLSYEFEQDDFFGLVSWKVVAAVKESGDRATTTDSITDATGTTDTTGDGGDETDDDAVVAAKSTPCDVKTGFAYYKREEEVEKKEVRILQIMPVKSTDKVGYDLGSVGESSGRKDSHTLYMCTECQMMKYKAKYNPTISGNIYYHTTGTYREDQSGLYMGLHEHKFGIVQYDKNGEVLSGFDTAGEGSEDWNSNLADDLADDYDFDLDILMIDELDEYAKIISANTNSEGTATKMSENDGVKRYDIDGNEIKPTDEQADWTWIEYYQAQSDIYYDKWQEAQTKLDRSSAVSNLNKFLVELKDKVGESGVKGNVGTVDADQVQKWIDHEAYYNLFLFLTWHDNSTSNVLTSDEFAKYKSYYSQWVTLHDDVVKYHEAYNKYSCLSCTSSEWLGKNYSMVVLGFAEDFGGSDLTSSECTMIRNYVSDGGDLLLTHDSTTRYANAGSVTLTTELRDVFGLDRFHATMDTSKSTTLSTSDSFLKDIYIRDTTGYYYYGPVYVTNHNMKVKVVKTDKYADSSGKYLSKHFTSSGNDYWIYNVYSVEYEDSKVTSGSIKITFEFYDSEDDAKNNVKTTNSWLSYVSSNDNVSLQICCGASGGSLQYVDQVTTWTMTDNTYTLDNYWSGYRVGTASVSTLKMPYYTFSDSKYFVTQKYILGSQTDEVGDRIAWQYAVENGTRVGNVDNFCVLSLVGTTDATGIYETGSSSTSPYKYAEYNLQDQISWSMGNTTGNDDVGGTNKATQVNKGIVTTYPFQVAENLTISATHPQTYAADLEDSNMVVWYTLAGTNLGSTLNTRKSRSSLLAASPHDGMDNYFLYSYRYGSGVVHYCGAGHASVTGPGKNNNDERMLYMNIVVDSVRNQGSKPKITVYEPDDEKGVNGKRTELTKDNNGTYVYKTDNISDVPEFDFTVKFNSLSTLQDVYVFYDLNYDGANGDYSNKYTNDSNHVLIHHYVNPAKGDSVDDKVKVEKSKMLAMMREKKFIYTPTEAEQDGGCTAQDLLSLNSLGVGKNSSGDPVPVSRDYFTNYGNYTYIVIYAVDSNGKTAYARIKISLTQTLFDLTQTEFNSNQQYLKATSSKLDICDRSKFNI
jgi:hypothetical protein